MKNMKTTFLKGLGILSLFGLVLGAFLIPISPVKAQVVLVTGSISASPSTISAGQSAHLTWSSGDATSITITPGIGSVGPSGSMDVTPTQTTVYTLSLSNSTGGTGSATATVTVNGIVQNPTVSLTADNNNLSSGGSTTLRWTSANATSCNASGGSNGWTGFQNTSGTFNTGALFSITSYSITCTNSSGGSASASVTVNVGTITPNPSVNLTADNTSLSSGGSTTLRWNSTNANFCNASGGSNGWTGSQGTSGTFSTQALFSTTSYSITCTNSSGGSASASVTVFVGNNNQNVTVNISADDTSIDDGDSTTIRWNSNNANFCDATGGTNGWSGSSRGTSGTFFTGSLFNDESYSIRCFNNNGGSANDSVTVRVGNNNNNNNNLEVITRNATNISNTSATLNGEVDGSGSTVRTWFEYGTNTGLGNSTSRISTGSRSTDFDRSISGLRENTTYFFRAVAENSRDTVRGSILSFNTGGGFVTFNNQPSVVITADNTSLSFNGSTTIRWNTVNATSCFASGGSAGWAGAQIIGPASFFTSPLTGTRTYTLTCSNSVGTASDSVTVFVSGQVINTQIINSPRPAPSSLVLINSTVDRNQPIVPSLDNTRPQPGDEINYTVTYQNVGTGSITNMNLRIDLPLEVDYLFSTPNNPAISGNTLNFSLGTLRANGQGTVVVRVRVRQSIPAGTSLNFPAILSYTDPSGFPQSVTANVVATIAGTPASDVIPLGANIFGAGFFPSSLFGWLLALIFLLVFVLLAKYLLDQAYRPKAATAIYLPPETNKTEHKI